MQNLLRQFTLFILLALSVTGLQAQSEAGHKTLLEIQQRRTDAKTRFYSTISDASGTTFTVLTAGVIAAGLLRKDRQLTRNGLYMGGTLLANEVLTTILKHTVNRQRPFVTYPDIIELEKVSTYSFPSGHTSYAFAFATSVSIAYPKWYVIIPSYAAAGLVGYSRLYLGVHYPGDVIGGAILGSGTAFVSYKLLQWWERRKKKKLDISY